MSYPPTSTKTYVTGEILTASDLNQSSQDWIDSNIPEDIDDYSTDATEAALTADPDTDNSGALATSMSEELKYLRFQILAIGQLIGGATTFTKPFHAFDLPSAATNTVKIDNTAVDGDPQLAFQIGGTSILTMGVDDTDDIFKIGSTAITAALVMKVNPVLAPHVTVISADAITELWVDNTATDGDSVIKFGLSGTAILSMGIDDTDDIFKIGSTDITTATAVQITPTAAPQVRVVSSGALTQLQIDNTATDGDSVLAFSLSDTTHFAIGVDDGDGDAFKIGTTGIGTATAYSIATGAASHIWYTAGTGRITLDTTQLSPFTSDAMGLGKSGQLWTDVWATDGTIETSVSSSKKNIRDMKKEETKVPKGIVFNRPEKEGAPTRPARMGFSADNLPVECFAINFDGTRSTKDVYTSAVIGILCNKINDLEERLAVVEL